MRADIQTDRHTDKHADDIIFLLAEQRSVLYTHVHVHFTARCILSFTKDDPGSYELSDRPADQSLFNNHIACAARLTDKLAVCTWTTSASDSDQLAMLVPSITRFSCIVARCSQAVSVSQGRTLDFLLGVAIDNNACNNLHYRGLLPSTDIHVSMELRVVVLCSSATVHRKQVLKSFKTFKISVPRGFGWGIRHYSVLKCSTRSLLRVGGRSSCCCWRIRGRAASNDGTTSDRQRRD